jgi:hypothetical protein
VQEDTCTEGQGASASLSSAGTAGILKVIDNGKNPFPDNLSVPPVVFYECKTPVDITQRS